MLILAFVFLDLLSCAMDFNFSLNSVICVGCFHCIHGPWSTHKSISKVTSFGTLGECYVCKNGCFWFLFLFLYQLIEGKYGPTCKEEY